MPVTPQNTVAQTFKALHKPGQPLVLLNVYDAVSARTLALQPQIHALATASAAVASAAGLSDDDLTLEANLAAVRTIAPIAQQHNKPLTIDLQDGYGTRLEEAIGAVIQLGAVGCNLEDYGRGIGRLYDIDEMVERIRRVQRKAVSLGVPDFVVNARTDALVVGDAFETAVERAKAYLAAGATTAFVWGGQRRGGITIDEVVQLTEHLKGKLNVSMKLKGGLTVSELAGIGVARISVGPGMMNAVKDALVSEVQKVFPSK